MKAITYSKGVTPVPLHIGEVQAPVPKDGEVLVRVHASALNTGDVARIRMGLIRTRPAVTGSEYAGEVVQVGKNVAGVSVGDRVYGLKKSGAHAEFATQSGDDLLVHIPESLSYAEAATIPNGAMAALFFLKKAGVREGTELLIYGASGSVGTYAVQLAKALGADVTAVCGPASVEMVRSLGADTVLDYRATDFTESGELYDVIFDAVGKLSIAGARRVLKSPGAFVTTQFSMGIAIQSFLSKSRAQKILFGFARNSREDLEFINGLVSAQKLRPVLDREYPMDQVDEAFAYVESGRKKGNVAITISSGR